MGVVADYMFACVLGKLGGRGTRKHIFFQLAVLILFLVALIYFLASTLPVLRIGMYDFEIYLRAGNAVANKQNPYNISLQPGQAPFLYPLALAYVFVPLASLPLETANAVWFSLCLISLVGGYLFIFEVIQRDENSNPVIGLAILLMIGFLFYPVWTNAKLGQINSIVFFLVAGSLRAAKGEHPVRAGALLGLACAIKLIPLVILLYVISRRQIKFGVTACIVFIVIQLLPAIWFPEIVMEYWRSIMPSISRENVAINISLVNLIRVTSGLENGLLVSVAAVLSGLALIVPFVKSIFAPYIDKNEIALLITGTAIFGPIVENHHLVWLIFPMWLLLNNFAQTNNRKGGLLWMAIFALFSQPFRVARLVEQIFSIQLPQDALQGGVILALGSMTLYVCLLLGLLTTKKRL